MLVGKKFARDQWCAGGVRAAWVFESRIRRRTGEVVGHGVVLGVVAEALGDDGVAEKEGKVGEDVLLGSGNGARGRERSRPALRVFLHVTDTSHLCL